MKRLIFKSSKAGANQSGAMEAETISKHGRNPKSQMSRGNIKIFALAVLIVAGLFAVKSCKRDKDEGEGGVSREIIDLVNSVKVFTEAKEQELTIETVSERSYNENSNTPPEGYTKSTKAADDVECFAYNTLWTCETKKYSASQNPDDYCMFNPLASVLWPGNLVQGKSLETGLPTNIPVTKRQPGNISLAIVSSGSTGATMFRTVEKMQFSYVNNAMNEILSEFTGQGYAQYNFEMETINSSEHLEFVLNGSFAGWGASVKAGLSFNNSEEKRRVLVKLYQSYFTMVYDDPAGLDGVFTPDITINDIRNYTENGNPICYISSVTYGRIYYLLYESSASEEDLKFALNASYKGFGAGGGVDVETKYSEIMQKTTCRVFQLGGGGQGGITGAMACDLDKTREFIEKGINFNVENTGAPISYTVKYLKNGQIVKMNNAMEYQVENCIPEVTENECPEPPQVTTTAVTNFDGRTATFGGNIILAGTPEYFERGVVYATSYDPLPGFGNNKTVIAGTGTGSFSTNISGLTPLTTYYMRAFVTNTEGTGWGNLVSFTTTEALPELSTNNPTPAAITPSSAILGGNITFLGLPVYNERGVVYSTTIQYPSVDDSPKSINVEKEILGSFNDKVENLFENETYYARAYATSTAGTAYGNRVVFSTGAKLALITNDATNINSTFATLGGEIIVNGTPPYSERGVVYATTPSPTINNNKWVIAGTGTGIFNDVVNNLTANTMYYVRAYAIDFEGTPQYGANGQVSFKTDIITPALTINPYVINIEANSVTFNGNITNAGTPEYIERGFVYATTSNPTISNTKIVVSGTGTGSFNANVTGLKEETMYYIRSYATNALGTTYYSNTQNFTMPTIIDISTVLNGDRGKWEFKDDVLTVKDGANIIITGSVNNSKRHIDVAPNATVNITIKNCSITDITTYGCPFYLFSGATVTLTLEGNNIFTARSGWPGINTTGATLIIEGTGSLTATGGDGAAGIGGVGGSNGADRGTSCNTTLKVGNPGNKGSDGGTIIINSGSITAKGGSRGAGIGGGGGGNGGNGYYCNEANGSGGHGGAGGDGGAGGEIHIYGGTITAVGNGGGADIGGGAGGNGGNGGDRNPNGIMFTKPGGNGGNGGKGGDGGSSGSYTKNGGTVTATNAGKGGAGGSGGTKGNGGSATDGDKGKDGE